MTGMPKTVQAAMEANPDIPGCDTDKWEKHLTHHVRAHRHRQPDLNDEQSITQSQLLKIITINTIN